MACIYHNPLYRRARPIEQVGAGDVERVAEWRKARMGWTAIARNLGVTEDAARRRFDPTYRKGPK